MLGSLFIKKGREMTRERRLIADTTATKFTDKTEVLLESVIDGIFKTDVQLLALAAANLSWEKRVEVLYENEKIGYLDMSPKIADSLKDFADHQRRPGIEYYFITEIRVNRLTSKEFTKLQHNQKIIGSAFAVNDVVYASGASTRKVQYEVWLGAIPLLRLYLSDTSGISPFERAKKLSGGTINGYNFISILRDTTTLKNFFDKNVIPANTKAGSKLYDELKATIIDTRSALGEIKMRDF